MTPTFDFPLTRILTSHILRSIRILILTSIFAGNFIQISYANIFRVNNDSALKIFGSSNEADISLSVQSGDTLMIEGSPLMYEEATLAKWIILIGPLYFLTERSAGLRFYLVQSSPYAFKYFGRQIITRTTSTVIRNLITEGFVRINLDQSDHDVHGFLIERWNTVLNTDIKMASETCQRQIFD